MSLNEFSKSKSQKVSRFALFMSLGTLISRILGLVRDMVIAFFFSRIQTDAFFVAFRMPNFFRRFIGEGALSISFIPIFVHHLSGSSNQASVLRAKNFMNSVYTILLVLVSILTVLGIIFMEPLLHFLFENTPFSEVEGKMQMTVLMAKILFVYLFLVTLYAYFMGIANALGRFFIPALAPAFLNMGMITLSLFPHENMAVPPLLLCWGVLLGGSIQVLVTAFLLFRLHFLPRLTLRFSAQDLQLMASRFFPGLLGVGGFALIGLLNLYFAGLLEEGTHTFIYYGDRLLELPRSLIAISFGTALLPSLSHFVAKGETEEMLKMAADQRNLVLFLVLPCSLAFFAIGTPIIEVLFQRGHFDSFTAQQTALVLKIYSVLLITSSFSRLLATSFYSIKNTWYPALCSCLYVLFHWFFTPFMIQFFAFSGLIWATVLSNSFFMCLLLVGHSFQIGNLYLKNTLKSIGSFLPPLIFLYIYLWLVFDFLFSIFRFTMNEDIAKAVTLFLVIFSSIFFYFRLALWLRLPQASECISILKIKTSNWENPA